MTNVNRRNKCDVLNLTESEQEFEEVNGVDVAHEIVEVAFDLGAAKGVWPIRKKGVTRTKATKTVRLAAASGSPIRVEGDVETGFLSGRHEVQCEVLSR